MPKGCVLLFEGIKTILHVDSAASLTLVGATLTAACAQKWQGVKVHASSRGFTATTKLYAPPPVPGDDPEMANVISYAGVPLLIDAPDLTGWAIGNTAFLHNETGIKLIPSSLSQVFAQDIRLHTGYVINCRFDSDSTLFRGGLAGSGACTDAAFRAEGWDLRRCPIAGNAFQHLLVGIVTGPFANDTSFSGHRVAIGPFNSFADCYLAAAIVRGASGATVIKGNTISLPSRTTRPRFARQRAGYYPYLDGRAVGFYITGAQNPGGEVLSVRANTISAADGPLPLLQAGGAYPHLGIWLRPGATAYRVTDNTVTNLPDGLRLEPVRSAASSTAEVGANLFEQCATGIRLVNTALTRGTRPPPTVWLHCNTFVRGAGGPNGQMQCISLGSQTRVVLDRPGAAAPYTEMMKNRFEVAASRLSATKYLYNANPDPGARPIYTAFLEHDPNDPVPPYPVNFKEEIKLRSVNVTVEGKRNPTTGFFADIGYRDDFSCAKQDSITNAGFNPLRSAPATPPSASLTARSVSQNNPNPFTDETTIAYILPGATCADLIVRDVLTGQIVKQVPLDVKAAAVQLSAAGLRPGVYIYCVVADGVAVATRRLLIGR